MMTTAKKSTKKKLKATHTAISAEKRPGYHGIEGHPGLRLRVLPSGTRQWVYRSEIGGQVALAVLGFLDGPDAMRFEDAAQKAGEIRKAGRMARAEGTGENPIVRRRAEAFARRQKSELEVHVDALARRYLGLRARQRAGKGPNIRDLRKSERSYWNHVSPHIGAIKAVSIRTRDISALRDKLGDGHTARHAIRTLSSIFGHAVREGLVDENPCRGVRLKSPQVRQRVLDPERDEHGMTAPPRGETRDLWCADAVPGVRPCALVAAKLVLATAARPGEVASMRWRDVHESIDGPAWRIPAAVSKNGIEHNMPLSPQAWRLIQSQRPDGEVDPAAYVFPAARKTVAATPQVEKSEGAKRKAMMPPAEINAAMKAIVEHFGWSENANAHDLRRSAATRMARLGVLPHVIEAQLNHISAFGPLARTYNTASYWPERRKAVAKLGKFLDSLRDGADKNTVVPFAARQVPA